MEAKPVTFTDNVIDRMIKLEVSSRCKSIQSQLAAAQKKLATYEKRERELKKKEAQIENKIKEAEQKAKETAQRIINNAMLKKHLVLSAAKKVVTIHDKIKSIAKMPLGKVINTNPTSSWDYRSLKDQVDSLKKMTK